MNEMSKKTITKVIINGLDKLPEYCWDCPCYNQTEAYCQADCGHRNSEWRPFWCPLKCEYEYVEDDSQMAQLGH